MIKYTSLTFLNRILALLISALERKSIERRKAAEVSFNKAVKLTDKSFDQVKEAHTAEKTIAALRAVRS